MPFLIQPAPCAGYASRGGGDSPLASEPELGPDGDLSYKLLWQRGSKVSLLDYLAQWDRAGRLYLADSKFCPKSRRGELFPVYKSATKDRVVFNRIPQNAWELPLSSFSRFTPSGVDIVELGIPRSSAARIFSEELADFTLPLRLHHNVL